jgi:hypothetical protein
VENRIQVYNLRFDDDHVFKVQSATLGTTGAGLVPDPHLFGSPDWWATIESGELPIHTITGTISRVFLSGHNDYPEFEIDSDGERSCWTRTTSSIPGCDLKRSELANLYRSGACVKLSYVEQRFKTPLPGVGECSKCVLEIWISPAV